MPHFLCFSVSGSSRSYLLIPRRAFSGFMHIVLGVLLRGFNGGYTRLIPARFVPREAIGLRRREAGE